LLLTAISIVILAPHSTVIEQTRQLVLNLQQQANACRISSSAQPKSSPTRATSS